MNNPVYAVRVLIGLFIKRTATYASPEEIKFQQCPVFKLDTNTNFWWEKFNGREPVGDRSMRIYYLFICTFELGTLLRNYAAHNGNSLPAFRYNLSGPIRCPETSEKNYDYALRNNPEKRRSRLIFAAEA